MRNSRGMNFIEVMIACLILAMAIIPIADFLGYVTRGTKDDKCETEAMQFACDLMDFILMKMPFAEATGINASQATLIRGHTQIKYSISAAPIPWTPVKSFQIKYHDVCAGGVECSNLDADITAEDLALKILDKEIIDNSASPIPNPDAGDFDLLDVKLLVEWRPNGVLDDNEYKRHPIVLYTRKARL